MTRLAFIGDSHAQIVFPELAKLTPLPIGATKPRAGWSTKKHLQNGLQSVLRGARPDIVVYSLGGNNHRLRESYRQVIEEAVRAAREAGAKKIIWVGPAKSTRADVERRHVWTDRFLRGVLPALGVTYISTRPLSQTGHRPDGVHFTRSVYRNWARKIVPHLQLSSLPALTKKINPYLIGGAALSIVLLLGIGIYRRKK